MELTITFAPEVQYKKAKFIIENLSISDTLGKSASLIGADEISYDNIDLYIDDIKYDGTISTWVGNKLSVDDIFEQCLNAYLRNDTDYESFSEDWKIFNKIDNFKEYQDDILIKMPVYTCGQLRIYELDLATPKNKYYSYDDHVLLLDSNGGILTDMEVFYSEALYEDICDIIEGNLKCLYKGENVDCLIKEYGGERGFLSEFRN